MFFLSDIPDVFADSEGLVYVPVDIGRLFISCSLDGVPPPDSVSWTHNSSIPIDPSSDSRVTISSTDTSTSLMIEDVEEDEGGTYECIAGNVVGSNNASPKWVIETCNKLQEGANQLQKACNPLQKECNVTSYRRELTSYRRSVTSYRRELTSYRRSVTSYRRELTSYRRELTSYRRELTSYRRRVTSYRRELTRQLASSSI